MENNMNEFIETYKVKRNKSKVRFWLMVVVVILIVIVLYK